jgi:hypothetical protein
VWKVQELELLHRPYLHRSYEHLILLPLSNFSIAISRHSNHFDLTNFPKVYAGERNRHATATGVKYINNDLLIAAQFLSKKIFLIDVNNWEILNIPVNDWDNLLKIKFKQNTKSDGISNIFKKII